MLTVYKYPVLSEGPVILSDHFEIDIPEDAEILTVDVQAGQPQLWALVDPSKPTERRKFRFVGTGHNITEDTNTLKFVSTFQMHGGALIFHVFEIIIEATTEGGADNDSR